MELALEFLNSCSQFGKLLFSLFSCSLKVHHALLLLIHELIEALPCLVQVVCLHCQLRFQFLQLLPLLADNFIIILLLGHKLLDFEVLFRDKLVALLDFNLFAHLNRLQFLFLKPLDLLELLLVRVTQPNAYLLFGLDRLHKFFLKQILLVEHLAIHIFDVLVVVLELGLCLLLSVDHILQACFEVLLQLRELFRLLLVLGVLAY